MIKNYLKIAWRNIWKNKTNSAINIFGMAVAFVCSILLFLTAYFDFSFDNFHADKDHIYKVYQFLNRPEGEDLSASLPYPVSTAFKAEVPDIEQIARYMPTGGAVSYKDKVLDLRISLADNDFFKVFTFPIVKGNSANPLADLSSVVISEEAAAKIFNKEEPIGKIIKVKVSGVWKDLIVGSVCKDIPRNSSIRFDVLARLELESSYTERKDMWNFSNNNSVYLKLPSNISPQQVESKFRYVLQKYNQADIEEMKNRGFKTDKNGDYYGMRLLALKDVHFSPKIGSGGTTSKPYLYTILLIGFFILAIACFNFINLNVARAFTRMKEVGVRKCLGANTQQIFTQVWGESLLICLIAFAIGILGAVICLPEYNKLLNTRLNLSVFQDPKAIVFLILGMIVVSFLAGGYPALVAAKFNTVSVLKGKVSFKKSGIFRNALIVFQFMAACLLMICTVIAFQQFEYMRTQPLGYNQESVISIPVNNENKGRYFLNQLRNKLASQSSIVSITGTTVNLGLGKDGSASKNSSGFAFNGLNIQTNIMAVDYDFLKTMDIKLLNGRDFSREFGTDTLGNIVVTESLAKQFKKDNPIGLSFMTDSASGIRNTIIGIIPDFHLYSLHESIEPLMIDFSKSGNLSYIMVKTTGKNPKQAMDLVENAYKDLEPGKVFQASFIDENTNRWYEKEKKLSQLLGISAGIAIFLSCLGLFAIALLMIEQRVKEIGIRKVLGASVTNITSLLSKDFLQLVVFAVALASPLAWWAMSKWLQDFPYRIGISPWVFAFAGFSALAIAFLTVSFQAIKAALANPVKSLRTE